MESTIVEELKTQAEVFLKGCHQELGSSEAELKKRILEVQEEIRTTGTYRHTGEELTHGLAE